MSSNQPNYVRDALLVALAKLDPAHPGFTASVEVRNLLNHYELRVYLDSWVIPAIECATGDPSFQWNRSHMAHDAHMIRRALQAHHLPRYTELGAKRKLMTVRERVNWEDGTMEGREYVRLAAYFPTAQERAANAK